MPRRPCLACGALITSGSYCRHHQPARRGGRWRLTRAQVLRRDGYRCVVCGAPATEVDHIAARTDGAQDTPANLQAVCRRHNPRGAGFQA